MEFSGGRFAKRRRGFSLVELCESPAFSCVHGKQERERENADTVSEFQGVVKGTSNINKRARGNWLLEDENEENIAAIYALCDSTRSEFFSYSFAGKLKKRSETFRVKRGMIVLI